jgi:RNA-directed DNA polymerase
VVWQAYQRVKANHGAAGVDAETLEEFEKNLKPNLYKIWNRLSSGTYFPPPVRSVGIAKKDGGKRRLGIPTIRDRVVETAALLILEPLFAADMESTAYGYRPGRTAREAVQEVHRALCAGHTEVVDADVSKYFDEIPHADLMKSLARRSSDRKMLRLLKRWLKAPVAEQTHLRADAVPEGWALVPGRRAGPAGGEAGQGPHPADPPPG